jgi:hypothetical protein
MSGSQIKGIARIGGWDCESSVKGQKNRDQVVIHIGFYKHKSAAEGF